LLLLIKSQQGIGTNLDRYGYMEEIHSTDGDGKAVLSTQLARGADSIPPVKFLMRPVTEADFLFEKTDRSARFAREDDASAFKLAQRIEDLNTLPRRPNDLNLGKKVEYPNGRPVIGVVGDLASDPPRRVAIDRHFFKERRKATPSNLPLPPSTARVSAIFRVMRGRGFSTRLRFELRTVAFIDIA